MAVEDLYRADWQFTQQISDAGFAYGPDRNLTGLPTAPTSGVKVRLTEPTQNQIAVAASTIGYESGDMVITIWADTLRLTPSNNASTLIKPVPGDSIIAGGVGGTKWVLKSVARRVFGWRWVCMVRESALTSRD